MAQRQRSRATARKGRRPAGLTSAQSSALKGLAEEKKRSWRWFDNQESWTIGTSKPTYKVIQAVTPESFQVAGAGSTTGTLTMDEEVIQAKEIEIAAGYSPPGVSDGSIQFTTAWYRMPSTSVAILAQPGAAGDKLRENPRYVWAQRAHVLLVTRGAGPLTFKRTWKRVTCGLGTEFGLLLSVNGANSSGGNSGVFRFSTSMLYSESGLDVTLN